MKKLSFLALLILVSCGKDDVRNQANVGTPPPLAPVATKPNPVPPNKLPAGPTGYPVGGGYGTPGVYPPGGGNGWGGGFGGGAGWFGAGGWININWNWNRSTIDNGNWDTHCDDEEECY